MMRILKINFLISLLALSACASYVALKDSADFPYHHSSFDYKTAWSTNQSGDAVVIEGLLKNVRYAYINDLDLTIHLLGPDGKVRSRATTIPVPQHSRRDEEVPFSVDLKNIAALNPGDSLRFQIRYKGSDGGQDGDGENWISSFTADALTGHVKPKE